MVGYLGENGVHSLCECNCGLEVQLGGRRSALHPHPGRQGAPGLAGLRLREAPPSRLLPERPRSTHAPLRRGRRDLRGDRLGHGDPRGCRTSRGRARRARRRVDLLLRRRRPGEPPPGAYATATRRALGSRYRSSALAQEKTGEFWVERPHDRGHDARGLRALRGGVFLGKNPWHSHWPSARARHAQEIAKDPEAHDDRDRPASHRNRGAGRHPSAGAARADAWLLAAMVAILVRTICSTSA